MTAFKVNKCYVSALLTSAHSPLQFLYCLGVQGLLCDHSPSLKYVNEQKKIAIINTWINNVSLFGMLFMNLTEGNYLIRMLNAMRSP